MNILWLLSEDGEVFSLKRKHWRSKQVGLGDYYTMNFSDKSRFIHRLVATAFVPNPMNKPFVNHIDGDKYNNHYTNLEWCTQQENIIHAWDIGLSRAKHGKLSDAAVRDVRTKRISQRKFAKLYGVAPRSIGQIQEGRTYKHIT